MKKPLRGIVIGAVVFTAALSGAALADRGHGGEHGQRVHMHLQHGAGDGGMRHGQGMEEPLSTLKSELNLTSAQEPAWQAFEQAVRDQKAAHGRGHGAPQAGTDPMEGRIAHMEQRLAGVKAAAKARQDLYQALTPEQKAVADRFFRGPHA